MTSGTIRETFARELAPLTDAQRDSLVDTLESSRLEHGMPTSEHVAFQVRSILEGWDDETFTRNMLKYLDQE